jgi:hypothetical protein
MRFLQTELSKRLAQTVTDHSDYHLLTDGNTLYLESSPQQIVDILKNSQQPMLAVCLSDTVRRVRAVVNGVKAIVPNASEASNSRRKERKDSDPITPKQPHRHHVQKAS